MQERNTSNILMKGTVCEMKISAISINEALAKL